MSHSASKTCVNALQAYPRYAHANRNSHGILTLSLSIAYIPIASSTEGRFREASQGGTNQEEGPEMRHKTFLLVPANREIRGAGRCGPRGSDPR